MSGGVISRGSKLTHISYFSEVGSEGDSYLEIAEAVLRRTRTPLSARQIMNLAYLSGVVPHHLHGATQYKTLGARLSEDILQYRRRSKFFRTRPGRFFLREFIKDKSLPIEFRTPIVAARRKRQLRRKHVAALDYDLIHEYGLNNKIVSPDDFAEFIKAGFIKYVDLDEKGGCIPIYSYVVIRRSNEVLVHRKGLYAEDRRNYISRSMLGFPVPLCHDDLTLFDLEDHGVVQAGLTVVANDLDLEFSPEFPSFEISAELLGLVPLLLDTRDRVLVGVVAVEAPWDFEPVGKRLAVGRLEWKYLGDKVVTSDFDPWSKAILSRLPSILDRRLF